MKTEKVGQIRLLISLHPSIRLALIRKNIGVGVSGRKTTRNVAFTMNISSTQSQREFSSKNVDKKKQAEKKNTCRENKSKNFTVINFREQAYMKQSYSDQTKRYCKYP